MLVESCQKLGYGSRQIPARRSEKICQVVSPYNRLYWSVAADILTWLRSWVGSEEQPYNKAPKQNPDVQRKELFLLFSWIYLQQSARFYIY